MKRVNAKKTHGNNSSLSGLSGVEKESYSDYYVGQISEGTTVDDLKQFTTDNGVELVSCFPLESRVPKTVAFRFRCSDAFRKTVLDPHYWPTNVVIRQWVRKRIISRKLQNI